LKQHAWYNNEDYKIGVYMTGGYFHTFMIYSEIYKLFKFGW